MRTFILLTTLLMMAGNGITQSNIEIITPGRAKKKGPVQVRFGDSVYIVLNNINPLFTDSLTLNSTTFNFASDAPAAFSSTTAGASDNLNTTITQLNQKVSELSNQAMNFTNSNSEPAPRARITLAALNKTIDSLKAVIKLLTDSDSLKNEFLQQYAAFKKALQDLSADAQLESYIIRQLKKEGVIVHDKETVKQNLKSYFRSINEGSDDDYKFRENIFAQLNILNNSFLRLSYIYDALGKTLAADSLSLTGKMEDAVQKVALSFKNASVVIDRKKFFVEEFAFAKQQITALNKDSLRNALISTINSGADLYNKIQHHSFSKKEGPYYIKSDMRTFKPQIKDKGVVIKEYDEIPVHTFGGVKVDFSTGYMLSFRGDEEYKTVYDSNGVATGIKASGKEQLTHAVGALINVYRRSANGISVGGSLGINIPTDGKLNFYSGISLLALENNRLVFTAGVSWTKVKLLNTSNLTLKNADYVFNGNIKEPQYDSRYRPAFFLGITYNIFSLSPKPTGKTE